MGRETPSLHIGAKAAQTLYYAVGEQAERIGLPLNQHITINYSSTVVDPRRAVESFQKLRRHHFNKWATRPRIGAGPAFPPTYAFAFENVRDGIAYTTMNPGDPHNVHVHLLAHVPASRLFDLKSQLWDWVRKTAGEISGGAEVIDVRPARPKEIMRSYLLKGSKKPQAELYRSGQEPVPQGIIVGRRTDASRNLGPTARRALDRARGIKRKVPRKPAPWADRPAP